MSDKLVTNSIANAAISGNVISSGVITGSKIAPGAITIAKLEPGFASKFAAGVKLQIVYYEGLTTFADADGGQSLILAGSGFTPNTKVVVNKSQANVTYINQYTLNFIAPALPRGWYTIYVDNQNGATSLLPNAINYRPYLKFYSQPGLFGNVILSDNAYFEQISATGDGTLVYTLESGILPNGLLLRSNGAIVGTAIFTVDVGNYNFNVSIADDNQNKIYRDFYVSAQGGSRITGIVYAGGTQGSNSAATVGGDTITVQGENFIAGGNIIVGNAAARAFTFVNSTTVTFTTVATSAGIYSIRLNNTNGTFAQRTNFFAVRIPVTWNTPAGSLGVATETISSNFVLSATADDVISYFISTGNIPTGLVLNANGVITGTPIASQANAVSFTTYTANVTARNFFGQNALRSFSIDLYPATLVSNIVYPNNAQAANVAGGDTVTINGSGFRPGAIVLLNNVAIANTRVSSTQLTFVAPATAFGTYNLYFRNIDYNTPNSIVRFSSITWVTTAGSLGNATETYNYNFNLVANSDASVIYTISSGSLPSGLVLSANGLISGVPSAGFANVTTFTTYSFTVRANTVYSQTALRSFTLDLYRAPAVSTVTFPTYFGGNTSITSLSANIGGSETVRITGSGFKVGASVFLDNAAVSNTRINSSSFTFITPAKTAGNYNLYFRNTDDTSANVTINYSSRPVWPAAFDLPLIDPGFPYIYDYNLTSNLTSDSTILYRIASNVNLPSGITVNANTGIISGTTFAANAAYSFDITAVDNELQIASKTFRVSIITTPIISAFTERYFDTDGGKMFVIGSSMSQTINVVFDGTTIKPTFVNSQLLFFEAPARAPGKNYSLYVTQSGKDSNQITVEATDLSRGQTEYITPGTYSWTAPANVYAVSAVVVGGGGGGRSGNRQGSGGGGLAWGNNILVIPGQSYTVQVGGGGPIATPGGDSYFISSNIVYGQGGQVSDGGTFVLFPGGQFQSTFENGGRGGTFFAANVYGSSGGGEGGDAAAVCISGFGGFLNKPSGGGGAGGYLGKGGGSGGANDIGTAPVAGSGGGGGGGGSGSGNGPGGGGGGGVGIYGLGADGAGGGQNAGGTGGSGGTNGGSGGSIGGTGGSYGGGGGAGGNFNNTGVGGSGTGGAVRIIWGIDRSFPSTLTADQTGNVLLIGTTGGNSTVTIGSYFSVNVTAIGASSYVINTGNLPPGFSLTTSTISGNLTANISGFHTSNANISVYSFTVRGLNSSGVRKTSNTYTIWLTDTIQSLPFNPFNTFTPNSAPIWFSPNVSITNIGGTFTANLVAYGLSANIWYSITSNGNIAGLTVSNTTKTISGNLIPNDGSKTFILRATDLVGRFTDRTFTISAVPQNEFTVPGTYIWTAPVGVTTVSAVAIGGGGGQTTTHFAGGHGGGGGGLGWKNNITVVPGQQYTVVVGAGGGVDTQGGISYFVNTSTVAGRGGNGRTGGTFVGDGGGNGGAGGLSTESFYDVGGGGGAGGYAGAGGAGGNGGTTSFSGSAGSGGAGGGGAGNKFYGGGGGGGVGIYGQGVSGLGGTTGDPRFSTSYGTAGSDGTNGGGGGFDGTGGGGGLYGGGAGAKSANTGSPTYGVGGGGAVRILYGLGQTYPVLSGPLTIEWLAIGGGGGGGGYGGFGNGGGGGAGGVLNGSYSMTSAILFVITVGGGGGGGAGQVSGSTGADSTVTGGGSFNLTAKGGGYGGREAPGGNGGSGGGGGASGGGLATQSNFVPAGFTGYGNNGGGNINQFGGFTGGGGGGAAGVGQNGDGETKGGNGGAATSLFSTWASATSTGVGGQYAGGGGGGRDNEPPSGPGLGGGGGATGGGGPDATANTGSGGGGANNVRGYNGGSGIVIARYVSATAKASGGVITLNGGYVYHTFLSSGNLNFT